MTYDPTVPGPAQRISDTQSPIQSNFNFIQSGDPSFLPESINLNNRTPLAATNDPAAIANAFLLYCKDDASATTDPELFGRNENGDIIQLTAGDVSDATQGRTFLPGGLLLQWNRESVVTGGTVTFAEAFAIAPYFVTFIPTGSSGTNRIFYRLNGNPVAASFSPIMVDRNNIGITEVIYYIALGRRV